MSHATPRPWALEVDIYDGHPLVHLVIRSNTGLGHEIAVITTTDDMVEEKNGTIVLHGRDAANAYLIVTAPELLDEVDEWHQHLVETGDLERAAQVAQLIAKAKGQYDGRQAMIAAQQNAKDEATKRGLVDQWDGAMDE